MLEDHPKVLIIGAGVSGLACARELTHRGYQVLIVEARDRVGGRIHSIDLVSNHDDRSCLQATAAVDVGGALIHGIQHNPIHALTREMGVTTRVVQDNCVLLEGNNGTRIDVTRDQTVAEQFNACLEQTFHDIQTKRNESTGSSSSSFGELFDRLSPRDKDPLYKWHQANLELSCGAPLHQLGYEWNDDEPYGYDGSHVSVKGGWNQVMEGLSEGLDIMYSSPIQQIRVVHNEDDTSQQPRRSKRRRCTTTTTSTPIRSTNNNNTSWKSKTNGDKVHVTLMNGKVLETNVVVCTLPLGILKLDHNAKGGVEFDPPLSREKQRSISRLGCGLLNKCVIQFPHAFWSSDDDFVGIVAHEEEDSSSWPHLILCGPDSTTLTFLFGGAYAPQVEEWSDAKVMEMCMSVLHTIYSTTTTTTPSLPSPLDYHVTRWSRDVYARGAFVYLPPSAEMHDLERLSLPITSGDDDDDDGVCLPLVCFAGEHTTPYHPSTIHGAFNSGIREAYRLDLSYFPKYNNHLQFEPEQVYKKTFTVKPKFPIRNGSKVERRRRTLTSPKRRGRGNMTLRKRPRMSYNMNGSTTHYSRLEPKRSLTNGHLFKPSRRSDRVQRIPAPVVQPTTTTTTTGSQQDRSLVRSYESCQDWQLVQSKVLPVFGTDTSSGEVVEIIPTETQLRARYQELRVKKPRLDPAIVKEWLVAPSPKRESERVNGTHVGRRRKSRRAKKTRVVVDV